MTRIEVAELLERLARSVEQIPGISRTKPHAFVEAKSEVVGEMRQHAKRLRTLQQPSASPAPAPIQAGARRIGGRILQVEVRRS